MWVYTQALGGSPTHTAEPPNCTAGTGARGSSHPSPRALSALTLTTLLLVLMLQMPPVLLGMAVMRMGVLLSPRVSSAKEAAGTRGALQPDRLSPVPADGERKRLRRILLLQHSSELWCTERAAGTAKASGSCCVRGEPGPPSVPSPLRWTLPAALQGEPRPPGVRDSPGERTEASCPDTGRQGCMAHRAAAGMALCTTPTPAQRRVCGDGARARGCAVLWGWAAGPGRDKAVGLEEGLWDGRGQPDRDEPWSQRARAATLLPFCRAHARPPASHIPPLLPRPPVLPAPTIHPTIHRPAGRQPSLPAPGRPPSPLSPCRPVPTCPLAAGGGHDAGRDGLRVGLHAPILDLDREVRLHAVVGGGGAGTGGAGAGGRRALLCSSATGSPRVLSGARRGRARPPLPLAGPGPPRSAARPLGAARRRPLPPRGAHRGRARRGEALRAFPHRGGALHGARLCGGRSSRVRWVSRRVLPVHAARAPRDACCPPASPQCMPSLQCMPSPCTPPPGCPAALRASARPRGTHGWEPQMEHGSHDVPSPAWPCGHGEEGVCSQR